jgi:hypothetical protein
MNESRPNFFIVGAPRCGTTALYQYLEQHPDIFMPYHKEPVYFGADLKKRPRSFNRGSYLELFRGGAGRPRRGEATVWYLYSSSAPQEIREFSPDPRIVIMLRNPVDMIYSLHSHMLFTGDEQIEDFGEALAAEPDRSRGQRIPVRASRPEGLLYRSCGRYAIHVKRWLDAFGPELVKVILFDDFVANPGRVYRETLEFLGVDPDFRPDFDVVNRNKGVRSQRLLAITSSSQFYAATRFLPGPAFHALRRGLKRLNTRYEKRPPLDPDVRDQLTAEFASGVEELGRLIGRDLTAWTAGAGSRG